MPSRRAELGKDLFERMAVLTDHLNEIGQALGKSVGAYNRAVGSLETRVCRLPESSRTSGFHRTRTLRCWKRATANREPDSHSPRKT